MEARARRADCENIRALDWNWLAGDGYQTLLGRLLQSMLSSAEELPILLWFDGCKRHFFQVPPPHLKEVTFDVEEFGAFPPPEVFEALLSLERFGCINCECNGNDFEATLSVVRSILSAFSQGVAFQCSREFRLEYIEIQPDDLLTCWKPFRRRHAPPALKS